MHPISFIINYTINMHTQDRQALSLPSEAELGFCCSNKRGMGLIECLMSEESKEIQYLNNEIRLLRSRNYYLRNDNLLLVRQVQFLSQQRKEGRERLGLEGWSQIQGGFRKMAQDLEQELSRRLSLIQQREKELANVVNQLATKQKKSKTLHHPQLQSDQQFKLQIQNHRLSIRVRQLQQKLEELNTKYLQSFQWRPYLLPDFHAHPSPVSVSSARKKKDHLRLDLQRTIRLPRQQQQTAMSCRN